MSQFNYQGRSRFRVGVLGATGLVGRQMVETLEQRKFPIEQIRLFATKRSAGELVDYRGSAELVIETDPDLFEELDFIFASAGSGPSKEYAPLAAKAGCVFIDNSSAWRMDPQVPLVVPEVNAPALDTHQGIIANPNCSTIQMVVALKPLHDLAGIRRVVVSTYQSVSGAGKKALDELFLQLGALVSMSEATNEVFPHRIASNCIPQIGSFDEEGNSQEEVKMVKETQKILDPAIKVAATTVRVPVFIGHSESVTIEFERPITPEQARQALAAAPGVSLQDNPGASVYPMAKDCPSQDEVFVGRIRRDTSVPHGLSMWIVADNLLKGAALNAVQIAETLIQRQP